MNTYTTTSSSSSFDPHTRTHSPLRDNFPSPNAIPPRTSSSGLPNPNPAPNGLRHAPSVLRPLSENDWLGQSKKHKHSHSTSSLFIPASLDAMAQPNHIPSQSLQQGFSQQQSFPQQQQTPYHAASSSTITPPPSEPPRNMADDLIFGKGPTWTEEKEKILLGPYNYLYGHPGKDIRSLAIAAFNLWLRVPERSLEVITRVVGMLHTASLLVDDVEDSSHLRRGIPVANRIFGVPQTINSANYVYFLALRDLSTLQNAKMIDIFTEELINLHRGQGMDLYWRDSLICPSEADYLEMVGNKTGGLFRLAVRLMQAESGVDIDCTPLVSTIGLLFQILDDHLNLSPTSNYASLKGLAEDLTEGKFSFPVIHAIRADPSNQILINILKQKTQDEEVKRFAIRFMEEKGSFEYSRKAIEELRGRALELVGQVEGRLGEGGVEGGMAVRGVLEKFVLK